MREVYYLLATLNTKIFLALLKGISIIFFNIIKKITFPEDLNPESFIEKYITAPMPWTTFSNNIYGTQDLWWLICSMNNIKNPTINPEVGKVYKLLRPELVNTVLTEITKQLK